MDPLLFLSFLPLDFALPHLLIDPSCGFSNPHHGAAIHSKRPFPKDILTLGHWPLAGHPRKRAPKTSNTISKGGKNEDL